MDEPGFRESPESCQNDQITGKPGCVILICLFIEENQKQFDKTMIFFKRGRFDKFNGRDRSKTAKAEDVFWSRGGKDP